MKPSNLIFAYYLPATASGPVTRDGRPDNFSVYVFRTEADYKSALDRIWTGREGMNLVKDTAARTWAGDDAVVFSSGEVMPTGEYLDALWETSQRYTDFPEYRRPAYRIKRVYNNFQVLNWDQRTAERQVTWYLNQPA